MESQRGGAGQESSDHVDGFRVESESETAGCFRSYADGDRVLNGIELLVDRLDHDESFVGAIVAVQEGAVSCCRLPFTFDISDFDEVISGRLNIGDAALDFGLGPGRLGGADPEVGHLVGTG